MCVQVQEYLTRFESIPDMLELDHLTVSGDVTFGKNVSLKVNVRTRCSLVPEVLHAASSVSVIVLRWDSISPLSSLIFKTSKMPKLCQEVVLDLLL